MPRASPVARPSSRNERNYSHHDEWRKEIPAGRFVSEPVLPDGDYLLALSRPLAAARTGRLWPARAGSLHGDRLRGCHRPGPSQRAVFAPTTGALSQRTPFGCSRTPALPA